MSSKFGFLKGRQAEADQAEAGKAEESAAPADLSEQFGRRADPTYAQINANIPADLRRQFRVKLAMEERTMQEVLELLIAGYVEGQFKV